MAEIIKHWFKLLRQAAKPLLWELFYEGIIWTSVRHDHDLAWDWLRPL